MDSKANRLLALFSLLCALPIFLSLSSRMLSLSASDSVYAHGDEAYTVSADLSAFNDGYLGFRCLASNMSRCYGGAQTWQDMATLAPFSRDWLTGLRTHQDLQVRWPWLTEYPRVLKILRIQRMLFAYAIPALFLFILAGAPGPWKMALLAALISCSPYHGAWEGQWKGIKSEHTGIFWGIIYLLAVLAALRRSSLAAFNWAWVGATLAGVWALSTRPSNISFIVFSFAFYFFFRAFRDERPRQAVKELAASTLAGVAFYVALNPNVLASSIEAKWLSFYVLMALSPMPQLAGWARVETLLFTLRDVLIAAAAFYWAARDIGWQEAFRRYGLPMAAAVALLPSCYRFSAVPYYMPASAAALLTAALVARDGVKMPRWALPALALLVALTAPLYFVSSRARSVALEWPHPLEKLNAEDTFLALKAGDPKSLAVDRAIRAPIREEAAGTVQLFDSLSDSPTDLLRELAPTVTHVYVTCWGDAPDPGLVSPAAAQWRAVAKGRCTEFDALTPKKTQQYINILWTHTAFAKIPVADLRKAAAALPTPAAPPGILYTRTLRGAWALPDHWNETLYTLEPSTELSGTFLFEEGLGTLRLPLMNDCKEPTLVTLQAESGGRIVAKATMDVDATPVMLHDRPWLSRVLPSFSRRYLASRRIIDPPLEIRPGLPAGSVVTVRIKAERRSQERCLLVFGNGNMTYVP